MLKYILVPPSGEDTDPFVFATALAVARQSGLTYHGHAPPSDACRP